MSFQIHTEEVRGENERLRNNILFRQLWRAKQNKFIIGLYQYALKVFPNLKTITHKFLIRGHTQNEGDSVHSVIEKQIKLSLKSSTIYTAYQYAQIIRDSKKKAPFFKVEELDHSNFFNFKDYTSRIGNNFNINTNSESIHFNDIKVLKLSRGQTDTFEYKTSYKEDTFKTINFARKRKTRVSQDKEKRRSHETMLKKPHSSFIPLIL